MVGALHVSPIPFCIESAEIGLHAKRPAGDGRIEQSGEIAETAATAQRLGHHNPLAVAHAGGVGREIVARGVHHCEPGLVEPYPGFAAQGVAGVEERHVGQGAVGGGNAIYEILLMPRVAVLPEQHAAVGRGRGAYQRGGTA